MKRREREAKEAAERAEDARLWWEHEKAHAERMKTQFRATKARTESARAVRERGAAITLEMSQGYPGW